MEANEVAVVSPTTEKKDPPVLRVRGNDSGDKRATDPSQLAKSIVKALRDGNEYVRVHAIGPAAIVRAVDGIRQAELEYIKTAEDDRVLVHRFSIYQADDMRATGLCLKVFPIPQEFAR